jgi:HK97 family phage prohead protease
MKTKQLANYAAVKEIRSDGTLSAVASTPSLDRDGEIITPKAFERHLERYKANPVIMAAHTHRSMSGMPTIIGSASRIEVKRNALEFDMRFAKTEIAKAWQSLYEDGHAKAFSVGFIPIHGDWKEQDDESVFTYDEVELLEISAVAVPSNPDALMRGGIDEKELTQLIDRRIEKIVGQWAIKRLSQKIKD